MDQLAISELYRRLMTSWNDQDATTYASLIAEDGVVIGFDGSTMVGPGDVETSLSAIFKNHRTAHYVYKVQDVRWPSRDVAVLRAHVSMAMPDDHEVRADRNAIQTLVAVQQGGAWKIAQFQNTPATFDGRPDVLTAFTNELQRELERIRQSA
jgi:uncharacterized protein (TIGR02246 family)